MLKKIKYFILDCKDYGWKGVWLFNYLPNKDYDDGQKLRYFGPGIEIYDGGLIYHFGFWFFNIGIGPSYK